MLKLIFVSILFLIVSLDVFASKLTLKSRPEGAEIYIQANGKPVKIGLTPFETDLAEIIKTYVQATSFVVELRKEGHLPYRVLLAKTSQMDLELSANLELDPKVENVKAHDALMNNLFSIQKLVRGRSFAEAIEQLSVLEKKHSNLSIIPEMKATAYYMNKDVENALSFYRRAFAINPDNQDAYRMKLYLEKKLGVDSEVP